MQLNKINKFLTISVLTFLCLSVLPLFAVSKADYLGPSLYRGDNLVTLHNVTKDQPQGGWATIVSADPGNVIEVRTDIRNEGDMTADHVQVIGSIPQNLALEHQINVTIQAPYGGGTKITGFGTVRITGTVPQMYQYAPGHARIFGVTNLYNCPNGCSLTDDIAGKGIEVGDIGPGESVQVTYKLAMTNLVTPSPSPSASPSVSPSVSPSASPSSPAVVKQVTPPTNELPNTGLPLAGLALTGLLPAGVGIRKFGKKTVESLSANSLWEDREMKR